MWRSVTPLQHGTAREAAAWLAATARGHRRTVTRDADGHRRLWLRRLDEDARFPKLEHFLVATLAGVEPKARPGFAEHFRQIGGEDPVLFATSC